ncbi:MAG: hypothetical protein JSV62_15925 [Promethearchaeota archaeon]|nr:MAG: hypothetical protein JSV62_15925 [Candidatus Lokiarchaeota archaeon]
MLSENQNRINFIEAARKNNKSIDNFDLLHDMLDAYEREGFVPNSCQAEDLFLHDLTKY